MFLYSNIYPGDGAYVRMVSVMSRKVERYIEYYIEHDITLSWDYDGD